jgi:hypothetical protein
MDRNARPLSEVIETGLFPTPRTAAGMNSNMQSNRDRRTRNQSDGKRWWRGTIEEAISLLPTSKATDGEKGGPNYHDSAGNPYLPAAVMELLPTPRASWPGDGETPESWVRRNDEVAAHRAKGRSGMPLATAVQLLPTPRAALAAGGQTSRSGDRIGEPLLPSIARQASAGALTPPPSSSGSESSDGQHHGQLSLGEQESA